MKSISRCLGWIVLFAGLLLSGGCSSFDHDWDAAVGATPADNMDISGRWEGTWTSDGGHNGGLRCLVSKISPELYHARYAATYAGVLGFQYEMDLRAEQVVDWVHFDGQADLGMMAGGVYHYDGHASAADFYCTYRADKDSGHFSMKRPQEP